jgi:hypothetical protein
MTGFARIVLLLGVCFRKFEILVFPDETDEAELGLFLELVSGLAVFILACF